MLLHGANECGQKLHRGLRDTVHYSGFSEDLKVPIKPALHDLMKL